MNEHMKFLDKKLLKTTIIKNRIFSVWDFFSLFPFILSCISGHGQVYFGCLVVIASIIKAIFIVRRMKDVDNEKFFVVKSVILGEDIEEGEDTISYYKYFKYKGSCGKIKQHVSKKTFDSYKMGDCFYLVFLRKNNKRQFIVECIFPCDRYSIDTEMKIGYADYSYWEDSERIVDESEKVIPYKPLEERLAEITEERKEEILSVGKQVGNLGKGMLISGITAFVLFIAFIATLNNIVLVIVLIAGAVFFGCLFKMIAVTDKNPAYDGVIYVMLKEERENKEKLQDESDVFERDFSEKPQIKKKKGVFQVIRKVLAGIAGAFSLLGTILFVPEGITSENMTAFVTFSGALMTSLLMIFTKLKLLTPLYITGFMMSVAIDGFFIERNFTVAIIISMITLLTLLPVIIANRRK